jgi:hypothetical protein
MGLMLARADGVGAAVSLCYSCCGNGGRTMALVTCRRCQRHVRREDATCPFCGAPMARDLGSRAVGAALVLGFGLTLGSCAGDDDDDPNPVNVYGPAPCEGQMCGAGQVCVHYGSAALCQAEADGGCPAGLAHTASCSDPSSGATLSPGCASRGCADIPSGCTFLCDCLCYAIGAATCDVVSPLYVACGP